jgi:hypothetical protein
MGGAREREMGGVGGRGGGVGSENPSRVQSDRGIVVEGIIPRELFQAFTSLPKVCILIIR